MEEQDQAAATATRPQLEPAPVLSEAVTGIILAGGRSARMGREKAWVDLAGRPLVRWVLDALREVTDEQVVVAREPGELAALGIPVIIDQFGRRGPLTGIHAGLKAVSTDLNLVVACDLPLVRPGLLAFLARAVGPAAAAVPYAAEGPPPSPGEYTTAREAGLQPLCAAYRRRCIGPLERIMTAGSFPTATLVSVIHARVIPPEAWRPHDPDGHSFFNVNTPEDVIAAARILAQSS
jgi:molybdopterin-guanine dinucleotide biosynthesis protein A